MFTPEALKLHMPGCVTPADTCFVSYSSIYPALTRLGRCKDGEAENSWPRTNRNLGYSANVRCRDTELGSQFSLGEPGARAKERIVGVQQWGSCVKGPVWTQMWGVLGGPGGYRVERGAVGEATSVWYGRGL